MLRTEVQNFLVAYNGIIDINVFFDVVATVTNDGSAWIYFWDVNLPGEMTTLVYTKMEYHRQLKYHIKLARDLS